MFIMHNKTIDFTIFTPCYNSAETIERTFNSILRLDFDLNRIQWLVVDNKSEDNTLKILHKIKKKYSNLNIKIIAVIKNKGINNSFNLGAENAEGNYWINIDSDDEIKENALKEFSKIFLKYENDSTIARIISRCETQNGENIGIGNLKNDSIVTFDNLLNRDKISGEMFSAYKTNVIKEFMFPNNLDSFINISWKWLMIASKYNAVYIDKVLRIYYVEDGTWTSHMKENLYIKGNIFYYETILDSMGDKILRINQKKYFEYVFRYLLNSKFVNELNTFSIFNKYIIGNLNNLNIRDIIKSFILVITPKKIIIKIKKYKVIL